MSDFQTILYDVERGRARIILNRPEKLNALSGELLTELNEALWEADNDVEVHAVVLRGQGRAFSAGYDLTPRPRSNGDDSRHRGARAFDDDTWQLERAQRLRMAIFDMHKPVIAQVHGYCLAGGTDVALLCDMVIAADDAVFGFPPARDLGALPNNMWLYNVGPQWAKRLTLTGDTVTGAEAAKIGLVLKSVPADLLEQEVEGLLDRLAMIDTAPALGKQADHQRWFGAHGCPYAPAPRLRERRARPPRSQRPRVPGHRARAGASSSAASTRREIRRWPSSGRGSRAAGTSGAV